MSATACAAARARPFPPGRACPRSTARAGAGRIPFRTRGPRPAVRSSSTYRRCAWLREVTSESAHTTSICEQQDVDFRHFMPFARTPSDVAARPGERHGMRGPLGDAIAPRARDCAGPRAPTARSRGRQVNGAPGEASVRIGSRAACRRGLRRDRKALDDAVFEGMEADHGKTAARKPPPRRRGRRELRQLPVHENPKGLERARGRILTPITPRAATIRGVRGCGARAAATALAIG